ncbi:MAG: M4 family metallopeptidase [Pyrinomonadaceae bacterium]
MTTKSTKKRGKKSPKSAAKKRTTKSSSKRSELATSAAPDSFRKTEVSRNGLRSFAFHRQDRGAATILGNIRPKAQRARPGARPGAAAARAPITGMDAETAARQYLTNALASEALPTFTAGDPGAEKSEFKLIAVEAVPLTGTQMVKFCQYYRRIPVYGSLVAVELDKKNELISINSTLTEPTNVDAVATVAPADVLQTVVRASGADPQVLEATPSVYYYFDREAQRWRLVYIMRDVTKTKGSQDAEAATEGVYNRRAQLSGSPKAFDYVVDAHSGDLVAELPRSHNVSVRALDGLKKMRTINCTKNSTGSFLHDSDLNMHTYDFGFGNVDALVSKLPGDYVGNPPDWDGAAVSAHANTADVLKFISTVLKRNGIDNMGGAVRSSINCVEEDGTREWDNATWWRKQMMYGQSKKNGKLISWAVAKDIVGHELTHGITDYTARIEYLGESGALNESLSDILGVIIANANQADIKKWNWLIGEGLMDDEPALRDMRSPGKFDQPSHMDNYLKLPKTENGDWGGVHTNSGIHNKAAYNMLTTKDAKGKYLLKPWEVAALFYLALTQNLSRTSRFGDSRRGVELAARSLFANKTNKQARFQAVAKAFDKVGIV